MEHGSDLRMPLSRSKMWGLVNILQLVQKINLWKKWMPARYDLMVLDLTSNFGKVSAWQL